MGFPGGSVVKNPPAMQETRVGFLGQKEPLEKEMTTQSSIPAWEIPWIAELGGLQIHGVAKESVMTDWLSNSTASLPRHSGQDWGSGPRNDFHHAEPGWVL